MNIEVANDEQRLHERGETIKETSYRSAKKVAYVDTVADPGQ